MPDLYACKHYASIGYCEQKGYPIMELGLYFGFDRDKNTYKSLVGNLRNGRTLKINANIRLQMAA